MRNYPCNGAPKATSLLTTTDLKPAILFLQEKFKRKCEPLYCMTLDMAPPDKTTRLSFF